MDKKRLADTVVNMAGDMMKATIDEVGKVQSEPIGRVSRSPQEMAGMMAKLQALPPEERQARMQELANVSGHKGDKLDNCGLCTFIKDQLRAGGG